MIPPYGLGRAGWCGPLVGAHSSLVEFLALNPVPAAPESAETQMVDEDQPAAAAGDGRAVTGVWLSRF